ncbi:MAG: peptidoglycan recognition family protein [Anaerolineales bacterium]
MANPNIPRRQFLACALGGLSASVVSACGLTGLGGIALWATRRDTGAPSTRPALNLATLPPPENLPMVRRADWGALAPDHSARFENGFYDAERNPAGWRVYDQPLADVYRTVVIHHSVEEEADDLATLAFIQNLHRGDRGWADVAYHYFIGKAGTLYEGRPLTVRGVHVGGHNTGSAGVCLLGNFMHQQPTPAQLDAARGLVVWLAGFLQLTHLAGHRAFNAGTLCPGDNLVPHLPGLATAAGLALGPDGYDGPTPQPSDTPRANGPGCACHT